MGRLNLPGKDGFEVLKWMNQEGIIERLPVIVISAENQAEYIAEAYDLGAVDYFSRPYDSLTVMSRLKSILGLYKKYEDLLRIANHLIYVVDIYSHRILYATDSFCQNYHVSRKEIYTKKCSDVICHGENTSEDMCAARIAANTKQPFIFFDKKVKKYYQIDARKIKWGQKDAYSIGLLDVTNLMRMNNENNTLIRNSVDSFLTLNTKMGGIRWQRYSFAGWTKRTNPSL